VKKRVQDEKSTKYPQRQRKGKFQHPGEAINDNPEERQEQIRSFASIIVNILLSDILKKQP
jgi:hypothetical protein